MEKRTTLFLACLIALPLGCDGGDEDEELFPDATEVPADGSGTPDSVDTVEPPEIPDTLSNADEPDTSEPPTPDTADPEDVVPDVAEIVMGPPTLSGIREDIFKMRCTPCHSPINHKGGLVLDFNFIHSELVNQSASEAEGKILVVPFDPDASFLVHKVEHTQGPEEGKVMPPAAKHKVAVPLEDYEIQRIRNWISEGAENN